MNAFYFKASYTILSFAKVEMEIQEIDYLNNIPRTFHYTIRIYFYEVERRKAILKIIVYLRYKYNLTL